MVNKKKDLVKYVVNIKINTTPYVYQMVEEHKNGKEKILLKHFMIINQNHKEH